MKCVINVSHEIICGNVAAIAELFRVTTDAFAPWIQPLFNNGQILLPWIISDDDVASELVAQWLSTVECLFTAFIGRFVLQGKLCTSALYLFTS